MSIEIINTTIVNNAGGNAKELMIQFIGAKNSFIDYISGTVNINASFLDKTEPEKVDEVLRLIKKEFYPEPFNEDLIQETKGEVEEAKVKVSEMVEKVELMEMKTTTDLMSMNLNLERVSKQILKSEISEEDYQDIISIYNDWETGKEYVIGDIVKHDLKAYEVIQAHTSQLDWEPKTVPALFKEITPKVVVDPDGEETEIIVDFVQPTGAHDSYKIGDKVNFEEKVYVSLADNNTYSPTDYPENWELQA